MRLISREVHPKAHGGKEAGPGTSLHVTLCTSSKAEVLGGPELRGTSLIQDHMESSNQPLNLRRPWPWIKEDHRRKEQGSGVLGLRGRWWEKLPSEKCLVSEARIKHGRLPPDPGRRAFGLQEFGLQVLSRMPDFLPQEEPVGREAVHGRGGAGRQAQAQRGPRQLRAGVATVLLDPR